MRVVQLPISPTEWAALQIPHLMTEAMWSQMEAVLRAMKPGIVQPPQPPSGTVPSSTDDPSAP